MNYYNEWDPQAAAWLRELICQKLIPNGYVDERSITEVTPSDLEGFTQCHFFAGIGGWPLALKLAGVPESFKLWTGSPPCQPFSTAGQSLGFDDERHLAPALLRLVRECQPDVLFGEQVDAAIRKYWLDFVFLNLEDKDYTCAAAVLPACSVGAPQKGDRLFFGAVAPSLRAKRNCQRLQRLAESDCPKGSGAPTEFTGCRDSGYWSRYDILGCRDGRSRLVEPGTFPLANGVPARVGRLRGYGNAIVPQVAAEFVRAFMAANKDVLECFDNEL